MMPAKKAELQRSLRYWGASFVVVVGFMYYKTPITMGAVLVAGVATCFLTVGRVLYTR